jgi:acyl carrier protein
MSAPSIHPLPQVRDELEAILREHVGEEVTIRATSTMSGELGLDSLELLEITAQIEDRFGVRLPDDALPELRTVGDVLLALERRLSEKGGSSR